MFRGHYHGKQSHEDDSDDVIQRAKDVGCSKFMVTGSDLEESKHAVQIASKYRKRVSRNPPKTLLTRSYSWFLLCNRWCASMPSKTL
jgi:hypothetical protein